MVRTDDGHYLPVYKKRGGGLTLLSEEAASPMTVWKYDRGQVSVIVYDTEAQGLAYIDGMHDVLGSTGARLFVMDWAAVVLVPPSSATVPLVVSSSAAVSSIVLVDRRRSRSPN